MTTIDLGTVGASDFLAHVGQTFVVLAADGVCFATDLVDVTGPGLTHTAGRPFTLTFAGGPNPPVSQAIHQVSHQALGEMEVFLVPLGPGDDGRQQYEAVFA